MKKNGFILGIAGAALVSCLVLTACPQSNDDTSDGGPNNISVDDTGSAIGGCAYSNKAEDNGTYSWWYKHYRLSISYDQALSILKQSWGEPMGGGSLSRSSPLSQQAAADNGVIFEETQSDYRLCRRVSDRWEAVGWRKENIAATDTGSAIGGCAYSEKAADSGTDSWWYKHYLLSISYDQALSILKGALGEPTGGGSLSRSSPLSQQAWANNGVIFEETHWGDYRLCRRVSDRWEAVRWSKTN
ncbi:MAG: hypothetical protein LBD55_12495 [Treponema sp.]|jgi:hypothetical protein|nr:hypothetical protein [Treponema sp.]